MQNNELEQGLRDRIYDYEMPVDTDQLWLDVQADLQPKKKRRGLIWWWLPGLLLMGSLGWFALGLLEGDTARTQDAKAVEVPATPPMASIDQAPKNATSGSESATATAPGAVDHADFSESRSKAPLANSKTTKLTPTSIAPTAPSTSSFAPAAAPEQYNQTTPALPKEEYLTSMVARPTAITSTTNNLAEVNRQQLAAPHIEALPVALLPKQFYDPETPPFSELKDPTCPVFTKRRKAQWSIGAAGIYSEPVREITPINTDQVGQRNRNLKVETPLNAITGQLLVGYETGSGFSLRSGLGYTRINSVAEVTIDTTITTVGTGISEIIINGPGDTTFITGIVERRVTTTGTSRYYNRLSTIDVPILLGKTFRAGKWRFSVEAGPVFNIITSGSARYQLADGSFSTRADNEGLFRNRLSGLGWQGSLSANFQVLPKLDIGLGVNAFQQPKGGFEIADSPTSTRYTLYGVRLGIKRYF